MQFILTLLTDPRMPALDDSMVGAVRARLDTIGGDSSPPRWLAPGTACDIACEGLDPDAAEAAARQALAGAPVDAVAMPQDGRRKRLLVADMESTIIENEMLDELADFLGLREHIAGITARAMNGEIDFAGALRERVALLAELPESRLEEAAGRIRLTPGAATLIATMRANGAYCALVSGGFTYFTALIRDRLGFDADFANVLLTADGRLTGTVGEPILGKEAKLQTLMRLAGERKIPVGETLTVGDGANDLPMLQAAGLGVAFHAKPAVAAAVRARVDHGDLTALLFLQGYTRDQFVDPA